MIRTQKRDRKQHISIIADQHNPIVAPPDTITHGVITCVELPSRGCVVDINQPLDLSNSSEGSNCEACTLYALGGLYFATTQEKVATGAALPWVNQTPSHDRLTLLGSQEGNKFLVPYVSIRGQDIVARICCWVEMVCDVMVLSQSGIAFSTYRTLYCVFLLMCSSKAPYAQECKYEGGRTRKTNKGCAGAPTIENSNKGGP